MTTNCINFDHTISVSKQLETVSYFQKKKYEFSLFNDDAKMKIKNNKSKQNSMRNLV